jgi:hypothetical protein
VSLRLRYGRVRQLYFVIEGHGDEARTSANVTGLGSIKLTLHQQQPAGIIRNSYRIVAQKVTILIALSSSGVLLHLSQNRHCM